ncbi:28S ribosomal protein S14, mitochondrial [Impatiens glandulifera]|uniref:28S ribosomal protein S14, mitochondrial n=1 Tax=Impatiens glandulifera TaxID=253017 RepID=UPI001FB0A381|nr:28S ribosomal protein S14, mitochondrial [Impatiens glandulifera]
MATLRRIITQVSSMQLNYVAGSSCSSIQRFGVGKISGLVLHQGTIPSQVGISNSLKQFSTNPIMKSLNLNSKPSTLTLTSSFHSSSFKQETFKKDLPSNKMLVHRNIRDYKRRLLVAKYELRRNLYKALCRDPDLPSHVRERHRIKLSKLPRNSSSTRVRNRCIFTGRPRAVYEKFRMSRIVFRELASRGELMGVKKASW